MAFCRQTLNVTAQLVMNMQPHGSPSLRVKGNFLSTFFGRIRKCLGPATTLFLSGSELLPFFIIIKDFSLHVHCKFER